MNSVLLLSFKGGFDFVGITSPFIWLGQAFVGRLDRVVPIILIAREDVEVEMKSVLIPRRLVVVTRRNAITSVRLFHGKRDFLRDIKNAMALFGGKRVDALEVLIWHDDNMPSIPPHKEGIDECRYKSISVNKVSRLNECLGTIAALKTETYRALIVFRGGAWNHM
jgi:hypothetical protein